MRSTSSFPSVYLYQNPVDFRKWINGLVVLIEQQFKLDPSQDALFVFISRSRTALKCVYWDRTGYALWLKKLNNARFPLPRIRNGLVVISAKQMDLWLDGFDIFATKPHETSTQTRFS